MSAATTRPIPLLPRAATFLLVVAIGVLAAQITWQTLDPGVRPPVTVEIHPATPAPGGAAQVSPFSRVADVPLFGVLGSRPPPPPTVVPETRLRLRLIGLVAGDSPDQGRAIIVEGSNPERLYGVGDPLGGGQARIHQIHPDRVVLDRNGSLEILRLPRPHEGAAAASLPDRQTASQPAQEMDLPSIQRSEWLADPARMLQSVQTRPIIRDGTLHGLEVRPTRNAREFQRAGLRPGDVITAVDGVPLSAIQNPESLFDGLSGQSQVGIVVERGGAAVPLNIQLID